MLDWLHCSKSRGSQQDRLIAPCWVPIAVLARSAGPMRSALGMTNKESAALRDRDVERLATVDHRALLAVCPRPGTAPDE